MKRLILLSFLAVLVFALGFDGRAQDSKLIINGKITSFEESLPLEGVKIVVKNSINITGTQSDGTFTLEVSGKDQALEISLDGYEKKEIPLTKSREYNIILRRL